METFLKTFIDSGIIEIYCMGIATPEEKQEVENMALKFPEVLQEITSIQAALTTYALESNPVPFAAIKQKIFTMIEHERQAAPGFPARLSANSSIEEWLDYIRVNNIDEPTDYEQFHLVNLPGNDVQSTYLVWAKKNATLEESHAEEDEYLFMIRGFCSITINGVAGFYQKGETAYIPKGAAHLAVALSHEPMLAVGQRIRVGN